MSYNAKGEGYFIALGDPEVIKKTIAGPGGREMPELMASLKTIHDTSAELIDRFEKELGKGASDGSAVQLGT